ncbi:hypothetical protein C6497_07860 [Candidatus Poribacteria bacterium]|nr:MAG: hypothetical protein C6497_07860 [Candidatus Poribacteria bacterium]
MDQKNQTSSESRFGNFFSNLLNKIVTFLGYFKPIVVFLLKPLHWIYSIRDFLLDITAASKIMARLDRMMYYVVLFAGIAAVLTSMKVEYEVMTEVYNSETDITNLPTRLFNFGKKVLYSKQASTDLPPTEQDSIPRKSKSWLPFLFVIAVDGMKCTLGYFKHSRRESSQWSTDFVRVGLFIVSAIFTFIFLSQLMNKPNEDKVNTAVENALVGIKDKVEKEDSILTDLKQQEEDINEHIAERQRQLNEELDVGRSGRVAGVGRVSTAVEKQIESAKIEREKVRSKIQDRQNVLVDEIEKEEQKTTDRVRKGGRALDPKWMSAPLSTLHEILIVDKEGNYPRRWATIFIVLFCLLTSGMLELIIIEAFKRLGREALSNLSQEDSDTISN